MALRIRHSSNFFHLHAHSQYSALDGMTPVKRMVEKAVANGQRGLALTDHGVLSGVFQLYQECNRAGIAPFPGVEAYLVSDVNDKEAKRYHLTLFALNTDGYQWLVKMSSRSHLRDHYHYKPLIDFADLDELANSKFMKGIVALTGCWFGWVQQSFDEEANPVAALTTAVRRTKKLNWWFPNLFVEIQHHNRPGDDELVLKMLKVADRAGLPYVFTQDSHYCEKSEKSLHTLFKQMAYGQDAGDVEFPGDSYHLATTQWVAAHYEPEMWAQADSNYEWLLDRHAVKLPFLDSYRYHMPQVVSGGGGAFDELKRLCAAGMKDKQKTGIMRYVRRLEYELEIVQQTGFADYFLLVAEYCQWMRDNDIFFNARGSANGSLICYLLDIIRLDPVKWGLSFDRFLTVDRERPPDIDIDVEDARRDEVIEHIRESYELVQIANYSRLGYDDEGGRGSIFVSFISGMRRRYDKNPAEFQRLYGHINSLDDLAVENPGLVRRLKALGDMRLYRSASSHAAGYAISAPGHEISEWMPTMLIPKGKGGRTVTQMTMDDVENAGWVKLDLLGSAMLTVIKECLLTLGKTDWDWVPLNDSKPYSLLRKGIRNTGVFQFEGGTNARGCRELEVRKIDDLIVVNALYRPATIQAGHVEEYLARRRGEKPVTSIHPILGDAFKDTYGIPVYQEQVLAVFAELGFSVVDQNKMLKAIKSSNERVSQAQVTFRTLRTTFDKLCAKKGFTQQQTQQAWDYLASFASYSFNKAHSTAYAIVGYVSAYLKMNYPLEYHTALLQVWAGEPKKEPLYIIETRRMGIPVLSADVNVSHGNYTMDKRKQAIRKGLLSINGVGPGAADELAAHAPYASIDDIINRTDGRKVTGGKKYPKTGEINGVILSLKEAGALRGIGVSP